MAAACPGVRAARQASILAVHTAGRREESRLLEVCELDHENVQPPFVYAGAATYYLSVTMWHGMLLLVTCCADTRTVSIAEGLPGLVKLRRGRPHPRRRVSGNPLLRVAAVLGLGVHVLVAALVPLARVRRSSVVSGALHPRRIHRRATSADGRRLRRQRTGSPDAQARTRGCTRRAGPPSCVARAAAALLRPAGHNGGARPPAGDAPGVASGTLSTIFFASLDQRTLGHALRRRTSRRRRRLATTAEDDDAGRRRGSGDGGGGAAGTLLIRPSTCASHRAG